MKKDIFVAVLLLSFFFVHDVQTISAATSFIRDMRQGVTGPDVLELQKLLNLSADTRITSSGPGSPGNETSYFGSLTRGAVIRFQEKYRSEVLIPAGVTQGTGFVGSFTRKKLNDLQNTAQNSQQTAQTSPIPVQVPPITQQIPPIQGTTSIPVAATPHIDSISPPSGVDGTTITIRGSNFAPTNTLLTGWGILHNIPSPDGKTITVKVNSTFPPSAKAQFLPYTYHIYVIANKITSNDQTFVLAREPGIVYTTDAEREAVRQENLRLLNKGGVSFLDKIIPKAEAQLALINFGGPIIQVDFSCQNGWLVTIQDPIKGPIELMFYEPGSILFMQYLMSAVGPNTVGNAVPTGTCSRNGPNKTVLGGINMVGTSFIPI